MLCQYAPYFWLFLKLCKSSHFLLQPVPIVYGSSSNLLSVREKKKKSPASKALQVFALFSSIVLLTKKKKEFFGTMEALSLPLLLTLFHSQLPNSSFQAVTFLRGGQLVILGCISLLIVLASSRTAKPSGCCG